jgi:hypothetical protein
VIDCADMLAVGPNNLHMLSNISQIGHSHLPVPIKSFQR